MSSYSDEEIIKRGLNLSDSQAMLKSFYKNMERKPYSLLLTEAKLNLLTFNRGNHVGLLYVYFSSDYLKKIVATWHRPTNMVSFSKHGDAYTDEEARKIHPYTYKNGCIYFRPSVKIKFDEVLEMLPNEIQKAVYFNLDLFEDFRSL